MGAKRPQINVNDSDGEEDNRSDVTSIFDFSRPNSPSSTMRPKTYGSSSRKGGNLAPEIFSSNSTPRSMVGTSEFNFVNNPDANAPLLSTNPDALSGIFRDLHLDEKQQHNAKRGDKPIDEDGSSKKLDPKDIEILTAAYRKDTGNKLSVCRWEDRFDTARMKLEKIAEASFAEVYRVTIWPNKTSILKLVNLKTTHDKDSATRDTSGDPSEVVSEIRIMYAMAEYEGFVSFKESHLVRGRMPEILVDAFNTYHLKPKTDNSCFPQPEEYGKKAVFLLTELGDAGRALSGLHLESTEDAYDVLIGVVSALACGEKEREFEHRDLHEDNVCYVRDKIDKAEIKKLPSTVKFRRSGLSITLIDYGLSRAKLMNGDVVYKDLEEDLQLFQGGLNGIDNSFDRIQFENYRIMRSHMLTGQKTAMRRKYMTMDYDKISSNTKVDEGASWAKFMPYSNVLWIHYIFEWLWDRLGEYGIDRAEFGADSKEIRARLASSREDSFEGATEILAYILEKGWVMEEQLTFSD